MGAFEADGFRVVFDTYGSIMQEPQFCQPLGADKHIQRELELKSQNVHETVQVFFKFSGHHGMWRAVDGFAEVAATRFFAEGSEIFVDPDSLDAEHPSFACAQRTRILH